MSESVSSYEGIQVAMKHYAVTFVADLSPDADIHEVLDMVEQGLTALGFAPQCIADAFTRR